MPDERDAPGRPPHRDHAGRGLPRAPSQPRAIDDSGEINPPPVPNVSNLGGDTPLVDVYARIEERVGRLSDRDRELVAVMYAHTEAARRRGADADLEISAQVTRAATPEVDRAELARALCADMPDWEPFKSTGRRLAKLEAIEQGRAKAWGWLKGIVSANGIAALLALGTALYACGQKSGRSESDQAAAKELREAVNANTAANARQDVALGAVQALVNLLVQRTNGVGP